MTERKFVILVAQSKTRYVFRPKSQILRENKAGEIFWHEGKTRKCDDVDDVPWEGLWPMSYIP